MMSDSAKNQATIDELLAKIERLEQRLEAQAFDLQRLAKACMGYDEQLDRHCKIHDGQIADAYGRIINLELKVFPNLARDMAGLHDVIGDADGRADHPLDRRKT